MPGQAIQVGPFIGGLNTFSDPTAVADNELVECLNFELDLDGSLVSRPPIVDSGVLFPLDITGGMELLGYYYAAGGVPYLIASDGLHSTYYFTGGSWVLLTNTIAASAMAQFDGKAWLLAPVGSANPGGYWTPGGGFVTDANMPKGNIIIAHKFRLWVAPGAGASSNTTRLYFSNVLGTSPFWPVSPGFIDVGAGDGQDIIQVIVYYNNILIFRTSSIYTFTYTSDPTTGNVSLIVPGVGLSNRDALVPFESYIYFMFDDKAYEFINNRASQINVKVPFTAISRNGLYKNFAVSVFNKRVIYSFYDTMYVFSLKTRTWTRWRSEEHGPIGKIITLSNSNEFEEAVTFGTSNTPPETVLATNLTPYPSVELSSGTTVVETNLVPNPSGESATTGYTAIPGTTGVAAVTNPAPSTTTAFGTKVLKCTWSTASTAAGGGMYIDVAVVAGSVYSFGIGHIKASIITRLKMQIEWRTNVGTISNSDDAEFVTVAGTIYSKSLANLTAPALATVARIKVISVAGTSYANWAISSYLEMDGLTATNTTGVRAYFAGDTVAATDFTYAWTGTAHLSTSTKSAPSATGMLATAPGSPAVAAAFRTAQNFHSRLYALRSLFTVSQNADTAVSFGTDAVVANNGAVTVGEEYQASVWVYSSKTQRLLPRIQWRDGAGVALTPTDGAEVVVTGATWTRMSVSGVAPATAASASIRVRNAVAGASYSRWNDGDYLDLDDFMLTHGATLHDYFDGETARTPDLIYHWTGTANASPSTESSDREQATLFITDGITSAAEDMVCTVQTKNFNYDAASIYKRLFWWGIDAIFRGQVRATVVPISFHYSVSWGELLGTTWGTILESGTWGQPLTGGLEVETVRDTSGSGSIRKFVKFMKSLRFRQVYYRVEFDTDGSLDTAPVRLFQLMTYVNPKERVSKTVT